MPSFLNNEVSMNNTIFNTDLISGKTNSTIVTIEGLGNANVNVSEKLEATISGAGNLTYKGNPKEIIKEKSGLGSINQK